MMERRNARKSPEILKDETWVSAKPPYQTRKRGRGSNSFFTFLLYSCTTGTEANIRNRDHDVELRMSINLKPVQYYPKLSCIRNVQFDISNTELIKLPGVHIDDNLNFTEHISKLFTQPVSQKVGLLSRLQNSIPRKAKLQLNK